jgi:putative tryptophan/tyrosine transport system substrate-binding protein
MWRSTVGLIVSLALSLLVALLTAEAQQAGKVWRISYLALLPGEDKTTLMQALLERLRELGYSEGKNMTFEYRSAEGRPERLPQLAMELVQAKPDVLLAGMGTLAPQAAKAATTTIPIVFPLVGDPIGAGLVASLGQPGGNVTGLGSQSADLGGKRLQLLQEIIPGKQVIAVLMNPDTPYTRLALKDVMKAAEAGQIRLEVLEARTADQVPSRFEAAINAGAVGLLVLEDPLTYSIRRHIAELAAQFRLPTMYGARDFTEAGGLMSYGTDRRQMYRRAAEYVDKILKGTKPADLPVEQPMKFEFVLNLKTAQTLGLTLPPHLLYFADEVIQ